MLVEVPALRKILRVDKTGEKFETLLSDAANMRVSPDHRTLLYENHKGLYTLNLDAPAPRLIAGSDDYHDVAWAPNSRQFAFVSRSDKQFQIFTLDARHLDKTPQQLTFGDDAHTRPTWSPDGTQIAFFSKVNSNTVLTVINTDGTNSKKLLTVKDDAKPPSWVAPQQIAAAEINPLSDHREALLFINTRTLEVNYHGYCKSTDIKFLTLYLLTLPPSGICQPLVARVRP